MVLLWKQSCTGFSPPRSKVVEIVTQARDMATESTKGLFQALFRDDCDSDEDNDDFFGKMMKIKRTIHHVMNHEQ